MTIKIIDNKKDYENLTSSGESMLVYFWASWAEICQQMDDIFEELSKQYPSLRFIKIDAENNLELSDDFDISVVPTFVLLKNGKVINRVEGADPPKLMSVLNKFLHSKPQDINVRLRDLTRKSKIVLFMKGSPDAPECGFSRQIVNILADLNVSDYFHFDILRDEEVRQGLKVFANWPTYPQLWCDGELVGGLDIVKEMVQDGSINDLLAA
jgi:Grx4 family monothiol glutaredoxin